MLLMLAYISMLTHTAAFLFNITTWSTVDPHQDSLLEPRMAKNKTWQIQPMTTFCSVIRAFEAGVYPTQ